MPFSLALSKGACSNLACVEAEAGQPWLGVAEGQYCPAPALGVALSHLCPGWLGSEFTHQDPAPQHFCLPFLDHLRFSPKLFLHPAMSC